MAAVRETIAVVDKSGKMVTTSKHLFGVFKEARNAYRERKAEIQAAKNAEKQARIAEQEALRAMAKFTLDDRPSVTSSKKSGKSRSSRHTHQKGDRPHGLHYEQDLYTPHNFQTPKSVREVGRRHTSHELAIKQPAPIAHRHAAPRSRSATHIDMDLAYGEAHPSALERYKPADEQELTGLVAKAKFLLEEADCVQHTATATMSHLQKNPDAMAAVALTLAEISNLASKMAPSILASLKTSAPAVFALLSSPQFLIAAGVGVGVTIVMFGGYKIIKKLTAAPITVEAGAVPKEQGPTASADELLELQSEHLSRVEVWRRGVADWEADSMGSTVDGEFITPTAAMMSGLDLSDPNLIRQRALDNLDEGSTTTSSRRSKRSRHSQTSRRSGTSRRTSNNDTKKRTEKPKRPSRLRMMFTA
ncbi:hypothetical protein BGW36DRAFT_284544 [Talaromyces proteolyticus]|uniref:Uncharacterized protein n=1 Tax=Talaromyces proteolyticus TaxID=1131652 RepID=A0AAD4L023_9EURO|nr:uncharacterized protein BGW36DRAFT_284544 [Talaromyces proteolyticus]KAH8705047.1 hypothetical protein BGW36DRAFT_284544 [Talaromyces proteolyticus]